MNRTNEVIKRFSFTATLVKRHRGTICTDTCSDENIIDRSMLESYQKDVVEDSVEVLTQPRTFKMVANLRNDNK